MRCAISLFCCLLGYVCAVAQEYVPIIQEPVSQDMEVIAAEFRNGYECRLIEYGTDGSERIRAYLLVPDKAESRRCPALLMLHDHGARFDIGKEKLARPVSINYSCSAEGEIYAGAAENIVRSSKQWVDKYFDGVYLADSLASLGYVVLVPDALYWGDRASDDAKKWSELAFGNTEACPESALQDTLKVLKQRVYEGQRRVYESFVSDGDVWAEKILRDDAAAINFLSGLPYVDSDNIGAFGFSMGAHRCWLLSAYCDNVKCGAAVSWMTLKSAADTTSASSLSMVIPALRQKYDFPDIAYRLVPKPMLFLSGTEDGLFPAETVRMAFDRMEDIYRRNGSELDTGFFPGGHHCGKPVQSTVIGFFDKHLKQL